MKSPHKKTTPFFNISVILILIFFTALDLYGSLILNKYLNKIKIDLRDNLGLNLEFQSAYFEIFSGIFVNGLELRQKDSDIFYAKNIKLNLDISNLIFKKRLLCRNILVKDAQIHKTRYFDKVFLTFLLSSIKESKDIIKSAMIKIYDLDILDLINLDIDGYVAFAQGNLFLTRGKVKIKGGRFFRQKAEDHTASVRRKIFHDLNYTFEATYADNDLLINKLELTGYEASRFILSGKLKDFDKSFDIELTGELRDFLLNDVALLNNDYLGTKGVVDANFFISGPLTNFSYKLKAKVRDGIINILDSLKIKKLNSDLTWNEKAIYLQLSGFLDKSPLVLNLNIDNNDAREISSRLLIQNLERFNAVSMNFQGYLKDSVLGGKVESIFDYQEQQRNKSTSIILKDINFNLKTLGLFCDKLDILWAETDKDHIKKTQKEIKFEKIDCDLAITKNNLTVDDILAEFYKGTLKGNIIFDFKENILSYDSRVYLDNVGIDNLLKEFFSIRYRLSGNLTGRISINSELKKAISGDVRVVDGRIENNEVLVAVSNFFGIPSLKTVDFSDLKINFHKAWDKYNAEINLVSRDIRVYLNSQYFEDKTMDGYLSVVLATRLMDESPRFRRLFKYIGYKEPTVNFPFKLKGYVDRPRIEWLKNEFKEKLEGFLPEGHKRILQDELNKLAGEFAK